MDIQPLIDRINDPENVGGGPNEVSEKTKQIYINVVKRIRASAPDFKFPLTKKEDLTKVKAMLSKQSNINTQLQFLNVIIVLRREWEQESEKLKEYRKTLQSQRADKQIDKMDQAGATTMEYSEFKKQLDELAESDNYLKYIVNYLFFNFGLRNADLDITITDKLTEYKNDDENYIFVGKSKSVEPYTYKRANYKTRSTYGIKEHIIKDKSFQKAVSTLPMGKLFKNAQINNGIRKYLIGSGDIKMTEGKIFKMLIKHAIAVNDPNQIRYLADTRGTDIKTIREYYNMSVKSNPLDVAQLKGGGDKPEVGEEKIVIKIKKPRKKKDKSVELEK